MEFTKDSGKTVKVEKLKAKMGWNSLKIEYKMSKLQLPQAPSRLVCLHTTEKFDNYFHFCNFTGAVTIPTNNSTGDSRLVDDNVFDRIQKVNQKYGGLILN